MQSLKRNCLMGCTGFVGSTLLKQTAFDGLYHSKNSQDIQGQSFQTVVCAAAPAQKWLANREPEADRQNIARLMADLETITCNTFILISTVDVFTVPIGVNESTPIDESDLHAYGLHRRLLEKFVESHFPQYLIVRLPGLVGPGLRKNIIFDFLNHNNLQAIDSRGVFQFYPMVNLWYDLQIALKAGLSLVHLTAQPIGVSEVAQQGFGRDFHQEVVPNPAFYNMQTQYAELFGGTGDYQYSQREAIQAIRAYAQSEPITLQLSGGATR